MEDGLSPEEMNRAGEVARQIREAAVENRPEEASRLRQMVVAALRAGVLPWKAARDIFFGQKPESNKNEDNK